MKEKRMERFLGHDEMKDFVDDMDAHNEQRIEGDEGKSARIFIDETENDPADDIISSVVYIKLPFSCHNS
jgi:hypothetical protein